jgi:glycine/D-amino acid oxidase-like deaminating enzyme
MDQAVSRSPQTSYWIREALSADPIEPFPRLTGEASADVVVVGGGYTGLWTAWFLTERAPGIDVAVVEADRCGFGPSGRNGGFVTGWWDEVDELAARYGDEAAVRSCRALSESIADIGKWCREHSVDAWYRKAGWIGVASAPAQEGSLRHAVDWCGRRGLSEALRDLSPEEVQTACASPVFGGGVFMPDGATVQPGRLAFGLRRAVAERGVRIFERSRALGTGSNRGSSRSSVVVETRDGRVRAGRAVLSMGPWGVGWPGLPRFVLVRGSYILITAAAPERLEALGWTDGECISDFRTALHYFRTTPDGRIAFGGAGRAEWGTRATAKHDFDPGAVDAIRRDFLRFFPTFGNVPIEEAWGGPVDVSSLHHPVFGTLAPGNVHFALGYTGNGVGPSHLAGRVLSALAVDADDEVTALPMVNRRPLRFPPSPLSSVGAYVVQSAISRKERVEDAGGRAGALTRLVATLPRRIGYALGPKE